MKKQYTMELWIISCQDIINLSLLLKGRCDISIYLNEIEEVKKKKTCWDHILCEQYKVVLKF